MLLCKILCTISYDIFFCIHKTQTFQRIILTIFRKKNEEEAARRKADDNKYYAVDQEPQLVIDTIMENVSQRMKSFDKKDSREEHKLSVFAKVEALLKHDKLKDTDTNTNTATATEVKPDEKSVVNMDSVVSDLNSFLASTRRAISSPASQKKSVGCGSLPGAQDRSISPLLSQDSQDHNRSVSLNNSLNGISKTSSASNLPSKQVQTSSTGYESGGSMNSQSSSYSSSERKGSAAQDKMRLLGNKVV